MRHAWQQHTTVSHYPTTCDIIVNRVRGRECHKNYTFSDSPEGDLHPYAFSPARYADFKNSSICACQCAEGYDAGLYLQNLCQLHVCMCTIHVVVCFWAMGCHCLHCLHSSTVPTTASSATMERRNGGGHEHTNSGGKPSKEANFRRDQEALLPNKKLFPGHQTHTYGSTKVFWNHHGFP